MSGNYIKDLRVRVTMYWDALARGQIHYINTVSKSGVLSRSLPSQSNAADFNDSAFLRSELLYAIASGNHLEDFGVAI